LAAVRLAGKPLEATGRNHCPQRHTRRAVEGTLLKTLKPGYIYRHQCNKAGEATISFYCSDLNTGFTGRIEGVDGAGLLGMSSFEFRVLQPKLFTGEDEDDLL